MYCNSGFIQIVPGGAVCVNTNVGILCPPTLPCQLSSPTSRRATWLNRADNWPGGIHTQSLGLLTSRNQSTLKQILKYVLGYLKMVFKQLIIKVLQNFGPDYFLAQSLYPKCCSIVSMGVFLRTSVAAMSCSLPPCILLSTFSFLLRIHPTAWSIKSIAKTELSLCSRVGQ